MLPAASVRQRRRRGVRLTVLLLSIVAAGATVLAGRQALERRLATTRPEVASVDVYRLFVDDSPVRLTVSAGWERVPHVVTADAVRQDHTLWRRMQASDWDMVPEHLRYVGLDAMLTRYATVLTTARTWDRMSALDWDWVPHPIRALAFRHMLQYWIGYYDVGREYGIPRGLMADTAAAIVMSESWFEHRAEHVNPWGNRDVGLAQASGFARRALYVLHAAGRSDVALTEEEYLNPWMATRFVAIWLSHLLEEVDGDLDMAVRAYHRGVRRARAGEGEAYLEGVKRRRHAYIRNPAGSPAWRYLWERDRELTKAAWPWLAARRVLRGESRVATVALDRFEDAHPTWWYLALAPAPYVEPRGLRE